MSQIRLNLIAAASINGGIGIEGRLPWQIKKDLSFFKNITCATVDKGKKVCSMEVVVATDVVLVFPSSGFHNHNFEDAEIPGVLV